MKPLLVAILLFVFSVQSFGTVWLYVDYKINLDKYAINCVNKARPVLKCNGKCQLAKKIQEEEKKKQQDAEKGASKIDYTLYAKHFFLSIDHFNTTGFESFCMLQSGNERKMPRFIFRPPCS